MSLSVGARLGHYTVTAKLGEGGTGEVWEATDTKLNRALRKTLPARFQREAQVLASLNHAMLAASELRACRHWSGRQNSPAVFSAWTNRLPFVYFK